MMYIHLVSISPDGCVPDGNSPEASSSSLSVGNGEGWVSSVCYTNRSIWSIPPSSLICQTKASDLGSSVSIN